MSVSVAVQCEQLHTILYNPFIGLCIGLGIGQCEHTITPTGKRPLKLSSLQFLSNYDGEWPV